MTSTNAECAFTKLSFDSFFLSALRDFSENLALRQSLAADLAFFEWAEYGLDLRGNELEEFSEETVYREDLDKRIFSTFIYHLLDCIEFTLEISSSLSPAFFDNDIRLNKISNSITNAGVQCNTSIGEIQHKQIELENIQPFRAIIIQNGMPFIRIPDRIASLHISEFKGGPSMVADYIAVVGYSLIQDNSFIDTFDLQNKFGFGRAVRMLLKQLPADKGLLQTGIERLDYFERSQKREFKIAYVSEVLNSFAK